MTARFKDFGSGGDQNTDPISFKIHGEDFECVKNLQGNALLNLVAKAGSGEPSDAAETVKDIFSRALLPESYERFEKLIDDKERIVTVETLGQITAWLVEQYSGRPIQGPEQSQSGQSTSGLM
jgi:hypothetical protein